MKHPSFAQRAFILFCCFRVLCALDGDVFVFRTMAWANMAYTFARHDTLKETLKKTFDGKHPCKICRGITTLLADSPHMGQASIDGKVRGLQGQPFHFCLLAEQKIFSYQDLRPSARGSVVMSPPEPPPRTT